MSKYDPLRNWLRNQRADRVELSFDQIEDEDIIGVELPDTAKQCREWWANETNPATRHHQCRAWLIAGFEVEQVNLNREIVTFRRLA